MLFVMMFQFSSSYLVFADVNNEYHPITPTEPGHGSSNWATDVLGKVASTILDWVSKFVLAVANLAEKLITNFTTWLFGVDIFPWEDLIVFNNLPYLDANFLNPALGSIFRVKVGEGENTAIKDIVRSVYFSLLTLSLSIVGIGVAVASIKLAISTIAADKARYKETIVKCLYTVILLFTVHILISFMLYLNETICVGASQMLKNFVKDEIKLDVTDKDREKVNKFVKYNSHPYDYIEEAKENSDAFGGYKLEVALEDLLTFDKDNRKKEGESKGKEYDDMDAQGKEIAAYLYKQSEYRAKRFENYTWITHNCELEVENKLLGTNSTKECIDALGNLLGDTFTVLYADSEQEIKDKASGDVEHHMLNAYKIVKAGENVGTIISNLGAEFRNQAYEITQDNKNDGVVIAVYLYAIMLIQSIMLLITYIKRVFYILILSVIAPVVVIYDFFMGNGKNKIFSVWIKELATLIFVQSLQALLMTVMLAVVIKLYITASDDSVAQQSMGVYAIFIMALIPKIELLVKKIFGLGSGVMDDSMMGGKRSLLKTGLALKLGSNVLNNAGKVIGGVGMMAGAGLAGIRQNRIAKNNDEAARIKGETNKLKLGNRSSQNNSAALSGMSGESVGNYSLDDLTSAIKSANAPDYDELNRQKKHEIMQRGLKGLQQATSGIVETGGAMAGAAVGATIGLGTGGDDVFQDMLIGAGIGDKAGHLATDLTVGSVAAANDLRYQYGVGKREVKKSEQQVKDAKDAQKKYNDLIEKAKTQNRVPGGNTKKNVSSAYTPNLNINETSQNPKQQIVKNNPNRVNNTTHIVEPPKAAAQNNKSNIKNVSNVSSNISKSNGAVKQNSNTGNSNPITKASSKKEKNHFTSSNESRNTQTGPITNGSNDKKQNNNPINTGNNKQNRSETNNFTGTAGAAQNNPNTSNSAANDRINRNNIDDISNI